VIDQILKEKGHLSLASLTVAEFISIMDAYKQDKEFDKALPVEAVEKRKTGFIFVLILCFFCRFC
jgi:hypothetical protein